MFRHSYPLGLIFIILGIVLGLLATTPAFTGFSLAVSQTLQSRQPLWFVNLSIGISLIEYILVVVIPILFVWLWFHQRRFLAFLFLFSGLSWFAVRLFKTFFAEPCPAPPAVSILFPYYDIASMLERTNLGSTTGLITRTYCYPSGHTFEYVAFFGLLGLFRFQLTRHHHLQKFLLIISVTVISLVGIARVSIGAHWITDVIGSYLFGLAWLLMLNRFYHLSINGFNYLDRKL